MIEMDNAIKRFLLRKSLRRKQYFNLLYKKHSTMSARLEMLKSQVPARDEKSFALWHQEIKLIEEHMLFLESAINEFLLL
jgi:hypothetical protein